MYDLLFKAAAETLLTIGADPKRLGARLGTHRGAAHLGLGDDPSSSHLHCIVPGGGPSLDGAALGGLAAELLLARARALAVVPPPCSSSASTPCMPDGQLAFFGKLQRLARCARLRRVPRAPTKHRVGGRCPSPRSPGPPPCSPTSPGTPTAWPSPTRASSTSTSHRVTFRWKDYRTQEQNRHKTMALDTDEFIRRFLIHVLPHRFHRIRHYGLFANGARAVNLARTRELLGVETPQDINHSDEPDDAAPALAALS